MGAGLEKPSLPLHFGLDVSNFWGALGSPRSDAFDNSSHFGDEVEVSWPLGHQKSKVPRKMPEDEWDMTPLELCSEDGPTKSWSSQRFSRFPMGNP